MSIDPEEIPKTQSEMVEEEMNDSFNAHLTETSDDEGPVEPNAEEEV